MTARPTQADVFGALQLANRTDILSECLADLGQIGTLILTESSGEVPRERALRIYSRRAGSDKGEKNSIKGFPQLLDGLQSCSDSAIHVNILSFEGKPKYAVFLGATSFEVVGILRFPLSTTNG